MFGCDYYNIKPDLVSLAKVNFESHWTYEQCLYDILMYRD
jgi:hypothetical protein